MGNSEVNYHDMLPQEQPPSHLSLPCNSRVKIDVNVYNNTTRNDINSWIVIQASSAHLTNIFEMVNHTVNNIYMVPECKVRKRHYWLISKLPWRHDGKIQCNGLVFFQYHDSWKNTGKTFCIRIGNVIRRSGIKCCLSKWRNRLKSQSWTRIILLANNIIAIIYLFQYKKYQLSTFLLESLTKNVGSVSFFSQYIYPATSSSDTRLELFFNLPYFVYQMSILRGSPGYKASKGYI